MSEQRYRRRIIDDELDELFSELPAISLEGARGVGKTATAAQRARTIRRLDDPDERKLVLADPQTLTDEPPVLLDEWQRAPEIWDRVRRAVDDGAPGGSFLLTGSTASVTLPAHSGAGRIISLRMWPMSLSERGLVDPTVSLSALLRGQRGRLTGRTDVDLRGYTDEIVTSGFPGLRGMSRRANRLGLDSYLDRVTDRDFTELGHRVRSPGTLRRWMAAYAAASATCASFETIRDAATSDEGDKPARSTTQPYRDVLENLYIMDALEAWLPTRSRIARLSLPPKHHLVDPALAARLLGVSAEALLDGASGSPPIPRDGPLLGSLFESLVAQSVRVYAQAAEARVFHLRGHRGEREIDLIVERDDGRVLAIEVKLARGADDHDVRHLNWLARQIGDDLLDAIVITTGSDAYRRTDGIGVVPAALLGP